MKLCFIRFTFEKFKDFVDDEQMFSFDGFVKECNIDEIDIEEMKNNGLLLVEHFDDNENFIKLQVMLDHPNADVPYCEDDIRWNMESHKDYSSSVY